MATGRIPGVNVKLDPKSQAAIKDIDGRLEEIEELIKQRHNRIAIEKQAIRFLCEKRLDLFESRESIFTNCVSLKDEFLFHLHKVDGEEEDDSDRNKEDQEKKQFPGSFHPGRDSNLEQEAEEV